MSLITGQPEVLSTAPASLARIGPMMSAHDRAAVI